MIYKRQFFPSYFAYIFTGPGVFAHEERFLVSLYNCVNCINCQFVELWPIYPQQ